MEYYQFMTESMNDIELFTEASNETYYIRDQIYPRIEAVLNTPSGDRAFKNIIGGFLDRNSAKLHTAGPQYLIPFTDRDKEEYYKLFNIRPEEIKKVAKEMTKAINDKANFLLIVNNPIFIIFACTNRFYGRKRDEKSMRLSLAAMAVAQYPSMYSKYFKFDPNEEVMNYTIDNLSNKFIIKRSSHVFGLLMTTITQCYTFHKTGVEKGSDMEFVRYIMRIRNAYNSNLKKIASNFMENYKKNLTVHTTVDSFDDNSVVDIENDSNKVQAVCEKVTMALIVNSIDLPIATAAAKSCGVSVNDIRNYLTIILTEKNTQQMKSFIESILFLYLYDAKRNLREINSKAFLEFSLALYKKTNSDNKNIKNIKRILDEWGVMVGLNKSFSRVATLINYKRALYIFFVLAIQKYN